MIKKIATTNWLASIKPNKIKIFAKKPLNGGIPAIEKNKIKNENDQALCILNKFEKLDKNKGVSRFPKNEFVAFW